MAILNGGALRTGWDAGPLTRGAVLRSYPFKDQMFLTVLRGDSIYAALNYSASMAGQNDTTFVTIGSFLQVAGAQYSFNRSLPAAPTRLTSVAVSTNGEGSLPTLADAAGSTPAPVAGSARSVETGASASGEMKSLDVGKVYVVVMTQFIRNGNDGYAPFWDFVVPPIPISRGKDEALLDMLASLPGGTVNGTTVATGLLDMAALSDLSRVRRLSTGGDPYGPSEAAFAAPAPPLANTPTERYIAPEDRVVMEDGVPVAVPTAPFLAPVVYRAVKVSGSAAYATCPDGYVHSIRHSACLTCPEDTRKTEPLDGSTPTCEGISPAPYDAAVVGATAGAGGFLLVASLLGWVVFVMMRAAKARRVRAWEQRLAPKPAGMPALAVAHGAPAGGSSKTPLRLRGNAVGDIGVVGDAVSSGGGTPHAFVIAVAGGSFSASLDSPSVGGGLTSPDPAKASRHSLPGGPGLGAAVAAPCAIVFTDIASSSDLWRTLGGRTMLRVLALHNTAIRRAIEACLGYEVKTIGDAFMIAFLNPRDAVAATLRVQRNLLVSRWPTAILGSPFARPVRGVLSPVAACVAAAAEDGTLTVHVLEKMRDAALAGQVPDINESQPTASNTASATDEAGGAPPLGPSMDIRALEAGIPRAALGVAEWHGNLEEVDTPPLNAQVLLAGLRVRAGVAVGVPRTRIDDTTGRFDYYGSVCNEAARIEGAASSGHVFLSALAARYLVSEATLDKIHDEWVPVGGDTPADVASLAPDPKTDRLPRDTMIRREGLFSLRGVSAASTLYSVLPAVLTGRPILKKDVARAGDTEIGTEFGANNAVVNVELTENPPPSPIADVVPLPASDVAPIPAPVRRHLMGRVTDATLREGVWLYSLHAWRSSDAML
eukprot:TRINITY_DN1151_c0_g1_i1.p1 TRINITY_DN1151_c0_g1~~TRINITY_DN1151_c0_g1_i1.p1  ORF type:complete len:911 (-),score=228.73 TRINITY_DN1151_c0_g1_i1:361-3009(-)